jgi:zinc protease
MDMQTIGQQANFRVNGLLNDFPLDYYDRYPQRIAQVTAEQIKGVLTKYVNDNQMTLIVVAPADKVKSQLDRLGEVEVLPMPAKREGATKLGGNERAKKAA